MPVMAAKALFLRPITFHGMNITTVGISNEANLEGLMPEPTNKRMYLLLAGKKPVDLHAPQELQLIRNKTSFSCHTQNGSCLSSLERGIK